MRGAGIPTPPPPPHPPPAKRGRGDRPLPQERERERGGKLARLWPARQRRHRGQNRIDVAARLQAEDRAAVVEQVEFDITSAPHELLVAIGSRPRGRENLSPDLGIGGDEALADV